MLAWMPAASVGGADIADDVARTEQWRAEREQRLRAPDGWLSLAGLFTLKVGDNTFGGGKDNDIVLPEGAAPARAGCLRLSANGVELQLQTGVAALVRGRPVTGPRYLASDAAGDPDMLELGRLQMLVIERGKRVALRVRWLDNPARASFEGLRWFPIDEKFRIQALYHAFAQPRAIMTVNVLGDAVEFKAPGEVVFSIEGRSFKLIPALEDGEDTLFFMFRDETSRKETYPGGRFLTAQLPQNGRVVLDFNRAVNPPCAYTPYATCLLTPKENVLLVSIPAGERRPPASAAHASERH